MADRPRGREKNVTGQSGPVRRRGQGLGSGPVGSGSVSGGSNRNAGPSRGGGGLPMIVVLLLALLFGGGTGLSGLLGGGGSNQNTSQQTQTTTSNSYANSILQNVSNTSSGWTDAQAAKPSLNTSVVKGARDKRTKIRGDGKDKVTIMVYMCGADLESRSGMATRDLQEMLNAKTGKNINLIIYTGGATRWQNNAVSAQVNQVYQIKDGQLSRLVENAGTTPMTDPNTLSSFIQFGKENFEADRYELILWDHGQGSLTGYGYDEKYPNAGAMNLSEINAALRDGGVTFDFVGFDTCLMATVETANVVAKYADYMIASEETEPGLGWYYTDWLTKFSKNTSMPTVEIGQNIVDDFVETCQKQVPGQSATLSVVDLAELQHTVPEKLKSFAKSVNKKMENKEYQEISTALNRTRRFARSNKVDQVDLVNLTDYINTESGTELAKAIKSAVKYNRTSRDMTNSYGLSIYFPYYSSRNVDTMVSIYQDTEMDDDYARCIQTFARFQMSGMASYGGQNGSQQSLLNLFGIPSQTQQPSSSSEVNELINLFLGGNTNSINGLSGTNFLSNRSVPDEDIAQYVMDHRLDESKLVWKETNGQYAMELSESDWELINQVDLNIFYDDGQGYIDLGLDNLFDIDDKGRLIADTEHTWLAVNNQVVAYYHTDTTDDGEHYTINGYIPAMLNDQRVNLLVQFTDKNPHGSIIGANPLYDETETETVAKNLIEINDGDVIDFLCDFYDYNGNYQDSYMLGERLVVDGELTISDLVLTEADLKITYKFTDIYDQDHYAQPILIQ